MLTEGKQHVYHLDMDGLTKAINHMGGQLALATALNIKGKNPRMTVQQWKERGVPSGRVLDIERVTAGAVTRYELRPDLYPREG